MNIADIESRLLSGELKPRFHQGVGFIQAYLTENVRLHVWHPEMPGELEAFGSRHDHRFDLESHVLMGKVVNTRLSIPMSEEIGNWNIYQVKPAHFNDPEPPRLLSSHLKVEIAGVDTIRQDGGYIVPRGAFHESRAEGLTVTIMRKYNQSETWARILATPSHRIEHGFARKPDPSLVSQLVWQALRQLNRQNPGANMWIDKLTKEDNATAT